ncbi:hypothetical protein MTO96_007644 [Rhipicephalus appendiculatus]
MMWLKSSFYVLVCIATMVTVILATYLYGAQERDSMMLRAALAGEAFALSVNMESQRSQEQDSDVTALDWSEWSNRADIRDTLLEERVKRTFRWAGAFVLTGAEEPLTTKWIALEGRVAGDLITLPSARRRSTKALHAALRWALDNCAAARYVIKMDDFTAVHPSRLYELLNGTIPNEMEAVHCDMRDSSTRRQGTDVVVMAAQTAFFAGAYRRHCAGSLVLTSLKLLRSLVAFRTSRSLKTAPVPGLLHNEKKGFSYAIRNVSVGWLSNISLDSKWNFMFVKLEDTPMRRLDRYALCTQPDPSQQFLDVGCGTGEFTRDVLLPQCLPCRRIVGVDCSQEMVEYARRNSAHENLHFAVLDICADVTEFLEEFGQFERVYSFFCLHWVDDITAALKNISRLMSPSGECLLVFCAALQPAELCKVAARMDPWAKYCKVNSDVQETHEQSQRCLPKLPLLVPPPTLTMVTLTVTLGQTATTTQPDPSQQFLDVGCGTGDFTKGRLAASVSALPENRRRRLLSRND